MLLTGDEIETRKGLLTSVRRNRDVDKCGMSENVESIIERERE